MYCVQLDLDGVSWCVGAEEGWARKGRQTTGTALYILRNPKEAMRHMSFSCVLIPSSLFSRLPFPSHTDWPQILNGQR